MQYWALTKQHYNWASNYLLWCMNPSCVLLTSSGIVLNRTCTIFSTRSWLSRLSSRTQSSCGAAMWVTLPSSLSHSSAFYSDLKRGAWCELSSCLHLVHLFYSLLIFTVLLWLHLWRRSTQGHLYAVQEKLLCSVQKNGKCLQKVRNRYAGSWMSVLESN